MGTKPKEQVEDAPGREPARTPFLKAKGEQKVEKMEKKKGSRWRSGLG